MFDIVFILICHAFPLVIRLLTIWMGGWKSGKIKNGENLKKWEDKKDFSFFLLYLVERVEKWGDWKFFCLIEKKKRIENRVGIYLLICPFLKMMPNKKKNKKKGNRTSLLKKKIQAQYKRKRKKQLD